jgi:hypothetical protein
VDTATCRAKNATPNCPAARVCRGLSGAVGHAGKRQELAAGWGSRRLGEEVPSTNCTLKRSLSHARAFPCAGRPGKIRQRCSQELLTAWLPKNEKDETAITLRCETPSTGEGNLISSVRTALRLQILASTTTRNCTSGQCTACHRLRLKVCALQRWIRTQVPTEIRVQRLPYPIYCASLLILDLAPQATTVRVAARLSQYQR